MSSGQKAVAEDEDDWYALKERANIKSVQWDVYSRQAAFAAAGFQEGYTGELLIKYVKIAMDFDNVKVVYQNKMSVLKSILEL